MCNGFNPEGKARGMTQLHLHPRDAILLPPKGSCSNPIVSWFTIQFLKNKEQQQIAEKFVKLTVFCKSRKRIAKKSSNQLNINYFEKEIQKFRQINGKFEVAMEIP